MNRFTKFTAALALVAAVGMTAFAQDKPAVAPGVAAPKFALTDQAGKAVSLGDLKGKVVVLEWFNNECPFVQKQYTTGAMNSLASKYAGQDVVWLAINSTKNKSNEDNKKIAEEWKIERPILNDNSGIVGKDYDAKNTPEMFVIDKQGKIAYMGAIDSIDSPDTADLAKANNYVAKALDEVLAGKPVSTPKTKPYGCSVKYAQ